MIFSDGSREPLHGHNYRVKISGSSPTLTGDVVFDFCHIKPIVRRICDSLDHKLIIPAKNKLIEIVKNQENTDIITQQGRFSIPSDDVLPLEIDNSSVEVIAAYIFEKLQQAVKKEYNYSFEDFSVEVEETPGQSAVFSN